MSRPGFRLLAITPPTGTVDAQVVDLWLAAGAGQPGIAVVLREPGHDPDGLDDMPSRFDAIIQRCQEREIPLLLSCETLPERMDDADGIQMRGDPDTSTLREIREAIGAKILGRSGHSVLLGGAELVDYTCVAPIFTPGTQQRGVTKEPMGVQGLRQWIEPQRRIFALGGIQQDTAGSVLRAGVHGLAGISAFFGPHGEVMENVAAFCSALGKVYPHGERPS